MATGFKTIFYRRVKGKWIPLAGITPIEYNEREASKWKSLLEGCRTFTIKGAMVPPFIVKKGFTIFAAMLVGLFNRENV